MTLNESSGSSYRTRSSPVENVLVLFHLVEAFFIAQVTQNGTVWIYWKWNCLKVYGWGFFLLLLLGRTWRAVWELLECALMIKTAFLARSQNSEIDNANNIYNTKPFFFFSRKSMSKPFFHGKSMSRPYRKYLGIKLSIFNMNNSVETKCGHL